MLKKDVYGCINNARTQHSRQKISFLRDCESINKLLQNGCQKAANIFERNRFRRGSLNRGSFALSPLFVLSLGCELYNNSIRLAADIRTADAETVN